jgi:hypothetical protein
LRMIDGGDDALVAAEKVMFRVRDAVLG